MYQKNIVKMYILCRMIFSVYFSWKNMNAEFEFSKKGKTVAKIRHSQNIFLLDFFVISIHFACANFPSREEKRNGEVNSKVREAKHIHTIERGASSDKPFLVFHNLSFKIQLNFECSKWGKKKLWTEIHEYALKSNNGGVRERADVIEFTRMNTGCIFH